MAIASARDSRIVRGGIVQSFDFGDQAFPILIRNMKGGTPLFISLSGDPDPEAVSQDGDTLIVLAGEYLVLPGGGVGPYTLNYVTSATRVHSAYVQTVELGAPVNVDPGSTGGQRDTLILSPADTSTKTVVVGSGVDPLLVVNTTATPVFLTINSGTDPDTSRVSSDPATFELDGDDFMVIAPSGTGYEVRAKLHEYGAKRALLQIVEVQP